MKPKKLLDRWGGLHVGSALLAAYGWFCLKTSRVVYVGEPLPLEPALLALWHGRLAAVPLLLGTLPMTALVSAHADGQIVARAGAWWGINMIAGSTKKVGPSQLRGLLRALRHGQVFLTPDGPRGPREVAHPGASELARIAKVPLIPVGASVRHAKVLGSWDRALLPRPFTTFVVVVGKPLRRASVAELEQILRTLQREADVRAGRVGSPMICA